MKKVFLFMVCAASLATASAQTKFGVKAGANFATFTGDIENNKMKVGFNAGAFAKFSLTEAISLQPELVYSSQGTKGDGSDVKLNFDYLNIPILVQYNFKGGFYGETGPQVGFLLSAKSKVGSTKIDLKDGTKSTDFSWAFGVGYVTSVNVGFNARYNLGLSNINDDGDGKVKNSVFQVGVFYQFGGSK